MAPSAPRAATPDTARLIYEEVTRRFEEESRWRDELESKAGTFLGFVGVFLSILLLYGGAPPQGGLTSWRALALPTALQVGATLALLNALYGHGQFAGPSPTDVVSAFDTEPPVLSLKLADAYAFSIVSNRLPHAKAVAAYHLAVLFAAAGLVQLAASMAVEGLGPAVPGDLAVVGAPYWVPGTGVMALLTYPIYRGYAKDRRAAQELIYTLAHPIEPSDSAPGGSEW